jgi:hypothetical protein
MHRLRLAHTLLAAASLSLLAAQGMAQHLAEAVDGNVNPAYASLPMGSAPAGALNVIPATALVEPCGSCIECGEPCRGESFWLGSFELTFLHPHFSGEQVLFPPTYLTIDDDHAGVGPRCFWEYSDDFKFAISAFYPFTLELRARRFDFDVYHRWQFRSGSLAVGASVSAAELSTDFRDFARRAEETGAGAGFFLEGRHVVYQSDVAAWSVVGRGRLAELMGEWQDEGNIAPNLQEADSTLEIAEAALGLEYRRKMRSSDLVVQCMLEAQRWDTVYVGDLGLLGSTASIGFTR